MKVLMIGGSGIISSEICNLAVERGMEVTILNRGRRKKLINPKAKLIVADIRNDASEDIRAKIEAESYDVIIDFLTYNVEQLKRNLNIFDGLYNQYIFISSATAYKEKESSLKYKENDALFNDKWQYAYDKSLCEKYLEDNKTDINYTILRPYVTYGKTRIPFQIIPIQNYTIINRILNDKPVVLCNDNVKCTLTNSKEFAIAAVGVFMNEKAFHQSFNITSDCETTWEEVAKILFYKLGKQGKIIKVPIDFLKKTKNLGFNIEELSGDKARNMLFDNSKIKECVPEFKGKLRFDDMIDESIEFYKDESNQVTNYVWDARIDKLIAKYSKKVNLHNVSCRICRGANYKNRLMYTLAKNDLLYFLLKSIKDRK